MPFKDHEARRDYMRKYKRRQRERAAQRGLRKCYFCSRFPDLEVGGRIRFVDGFFITGRPEMQQLIEESPEFGRLIVSWPVSPDGEEEVIL